MSKRKWAIGGILAGSGGVALVFGIVMTVVMGGTGVFIIKNPDIFDSPTGITSGPGSGRPSGDYMDEYAKKIMTLDLDKLREDDPSKDTDPGMYTGGKNIAEEFEIYLLLSEICQRPEINPCYSTDSAVSSSPDAKWKITPDMLYGIWAHEANMSELKYGSKDAQTGKFSDNGTVRAYSTWDDTGNGGFVGPFQQSRDLDSKVLSGNARMYMYISRFESPDMPDGLRAIMGSQTEISNGSGILPDGSQISYAQISPHIKFNSDTRPSPRFIADSMYSEAMALRSQWAGLNPWSKTKYPNSNYANSVSQLTQWSENLGLDPAVENQLAYLWGASLFSAYSSLTNPPVFTAGESTAGDPGDLYRLYLQMTASGVPLDFWAKKDPVWCPPSKITTDLNNLQAVMLDVNLVLFDANIRNADQSLNVTSGSGIMHKLDSQGGLRFPNLASVYNSGFHRIYTSNKNIATQSPFPIEALNSGLWIQQSIWNMVDVYYGSEKYTLPPEEQPGAGDPGFDAKPGTGVPGSGDSDVENFKTACPRVTSANAIVTSGNKWYVKQGLLQYPVPGVPITHSYRYPCCGYHPNGHTGADITTSGIAGRPVLAVLDGVVLNKFYYADENNTSGYFGTYTNILHCVNGRYFVSTYAHMQTPSFDMVQVGDIVTKGQKIGQVGTTGYSTGNHLHFQLNYSVKRYTTDVRAYGANMTDTWNPGWSMTP